MKFISTRNDSPSFSFEEAIFHGLAPDKGLFVPQTFPKIDKQFLDNLPHHSLHQLSDAIMSKFITDIPHERLKVIIANTFNFSIPLIHLDKHYYLLEMFHGPTLAFKDVGARFMANVLAYFSTISQRKIKIIVATSGDTGSAIAHAFHHAPNIEVYILYPSKKISLLQEMQMTTLGGNIHALEVDGTFDDCQRLVKEALADVSLKQNAILTTSNSINIARLLPQIIYHAWGFTQLKQLGIHTTPDLIVPSGNLGNLTSAVYAKRIGFAVNEFIAATNSNNVFANYLAMGEFHSEPSKKTLANAMDVGNPSNFERLLHLYAEHPQQMAQEIKAISITDNGILTTIKETYEETGYILDPHTAVGVAAAREHHYDFKPAMIIATAHPAKFPEVIKQAINQDIQLPDSLQRLIHKPKQSHRISCDYSVLHAQLSK